MSGFNVASLFIDLGVKGGKSVISALSASTNALRSVKNTSIEAKAGIFGALYALEQISSAAVQSAVNLNKFENATGLSAQKLQQWSYWAEINNVKAEEMTSTIKGLQNAQAALALGENVPAGAGYFGLNQNNDPIEMLSEVQKKLKEIGNDQKEIAKARYMASTLGFSDDMFAALRKGTQGFGGLNKNMTLSGKEQQELVELDRTWTKFWLTVRGTTAKGIARGSTPLTAIVDQLKEETVEAGKAVDKFFTIMEGKGSLTERWAAVIEKSNASLNKNSLFDFFKRGMPALQGLDVIPALLRGGDKAIQTGREAWQNFRHPMLGPPTKEDSKSFPNRLSTEDQAALWSRNIKGISPQNNAPSGTKGNSPTIIINNNIDGAQDPQTIVDILLDRIGEAFYQNAAVNQQGQPAVNQ